MHQRDELRTEDSQLAADVVAPSLMRSADEAAAPRDATRPIPRPILAVTSSAPLGRT
jgi:hypothetical protein